MGFVINVVNNNNNIITPCLAGAVGVYTSSIVTQIYQYNHTETHTHHTALTHIHTHAYTHTRTHRLINCIDKTEELLQQI